LVQIREFLFLQLEGTAGHVVSPEVSLELIPSDCLNVGMGVAISLPPIYCGSKQLCATKRTFSQSKHWPISNFFSTDFSQSSASIGSLACEKVLGWVLKNLPSLDWDGGGGGA
jgi:hypothetical protein